MTNKKSEINPVILLIIPISLFVILFIYVIVSSIIETSHCNDLPKDNCEYQACKYYSYSNEINKDDYYDCLHKIKINDIYETHKWVK